MEPKPDLLFVYGTLRPSLARGEPADLVRVLTCVGQATVQGDLYDLGGYPGLVAWRGRVHGELVQITTASQLAALDAYEECSGTQPLFLREQTLVLRSDGIELQAWVYVYANPVTGFRLIPGGDYAAVRPPRH